MYKLIIIFCENIETLPKTSVFTYYNLDICRSQLKIIKDRYISIGCTIFELKIYKVEQIQDPDQI